MRFVFPLTLLIPLSGVTLAHEALDLADPSLGSAAIISIWVFAVLAGVGFLISLGLLLGNLGRKQNLVMAGAIGAVLSAGVAGAAGYALYLKQNSVSDRITLHQTRNGWTTAYGRKIYLQNLVILPVNEIKDILSESELGQKLQVPMLGLDVELPKQQLVHLSFMVPAEGTFLAMDGKLTIRGVSKAEFEKFLNTPQNTSTQGSNP
ncbi:hypothetical protein [Deinococcus roseus]|uniref:Uncharacterized protein n=1 Tax=Deinococcus roseus TaxID=392414 RepID=A0ABQ2CUX9_9DEIO|nr:hypothetical protein [Deinococcus roseus]GGJ23219.1 hypothetical protein GCM10008938_06770 [Deinococcus roseus]